MLNFNLLDMILKAQNEDKEAMLTLVEQFDPLLSKYARKINFEKEDAKQELILSFILLVQRLDISSFKEKSNPIFVSYIEKSVYHAYIAISKKNRKAFAEILTEEIKEGGGENSSVRDEYPNIYIDEMKNILSEKEFYIFYQHCLLGKSIERLAKEAVLSRQGINKVKIKARQKLKEFYGEDGMF